MFWSVIVSLNAYKSLNIVHKVDILAMHISHTFKVINYKDRNKVPRVNKAYDFYFILFFLILSNKKDLPVLKKWK